MSKFFGEDGVWVDNLAITSPHVVDNGDSGGPFYFKYQNEAYARGTIVGDDVGLNRDYHQMWSWIANRWDVTPSAPSTTAEPSRTG